MLVQLNTGKIMSLDSVTTIDITGTKILYTLNNNIVLVEEFDTEEEAIERIKVLFDFNVVLDASSFDKALQTAKDIEGEE